MVNWEDPWLGAAQLGSAQMLHHLGDERGEKPRPSQGSLTSGVTPRTFRYCRAEPRSECDIVSGVSVSGWLGPKVARSELYKSIISACTQLLLTWPWSAHTCSNMTTWGHWVSSVQCQAWTPSVVTPHTPGLAWGNFWRNSDWCKGDQHSSDQDHGAPASVMQFQVWLRGDTGPWPSPVWSKPVSLHPTHSIALAQSSVISFSKINSYLPI